MLNNISHLCSKWLNPTLLPAGPQEQFAEQLMTLDTGGKLPKTKRYFCKQGELFHIDGKTYAMTNQWGVRTLEAVDLLSAKYPEKNISIERE